MKKFTWLLVLLVAGKAGTVKAQSAEAEQLLLNVEKLAQLRQILADMKKGYEIVSAGYNSIKDLSQGNFTLHKTFLDRLMDVSPVVRTYRRVAEIINNQLFLVQEYKAAYARFKKGNNFNPEELGYMGRVYANLLNQSLKNLEALAPVLTNGNLRMSDDERLKAIDAIADDMRDKLLFLRHFNNNTTILSQQRTREKGDVDASKKIYGLSQ